MPESVAVRFPVGVPSESFQLLENNTRNIPVYNAIRLHPTDAQFLPALASGTELDVPVATTPVKFQTLSAFSGFHPDKSSAKSMKRISHDSHGQSAKRHAGFLPK